MKSLDFVLIQQDIVWEDTPANLVRFEKSIGSVHKPCDLIILPEMFNTGFTMHIEKCAEQADGISLQWMKNQAARMSCVIAGSILTRENNKFFNRFYWVKPDGSYEFYDKRHLFSMAGEHLVMTRGMTRKIVEWKGWKINLQVCYDLRFPVWSRNSYVENSFTYDMLIYIANWPEKRNSAYKALLPARAVENQCYVVWVNRTGKDGNGMDHTGDSMVVTPEGSVLATCKPGEEQVMKINTSLSSLQDFRKKYFFASDWDRFRIER
jgi:omega-amidase